MEENFHFGDCVGCSCISLSRFDIGSDLLQGFNLNPFIDSET